MLTGMIPEGQTNMSFSCTRRAHEDGIVFFLDEMEIKEAEDLGLIDRFREGEVKGIKRFEDREISLSDTGFDPSLFSGSDFVRGQKGEEIGGGEIFSFSLFQDFFEH